VCECKTQELFYTKKKNSLSI